MIRARNMHLTDDDAPMQSNITHEAHTYHNVHLESHSTSDVEARWGQMHRQYPDVRRPVRREKLMDCGKCAKKTKKKAVKKIVKKKKK